METKNISTFLRVLFRDATSFILVLLIIITSVYDVSGYSLIDQFRQHQFVAEYFNEQVQGFRSGSRFLHGVVIIVSMFKINQLWKLLFSRLGLSATMSPGAAVWRLFIPIYNYFWTFWVYIGMSRDANKILKPTDKVSHWPFTIFCCVDLLVSFMACVIASKYRVLDDIKSVDVYIATLSRCLILEVLCTFVLLGCYLVVLYHMNKILILINYCTRDDDFVCSQQSCDYVKVSVSVETGSCQSS